MKFLIFQCILIFGTCNAFSNLTNNRSSHDRRLILGEASCWNIVDRTISSKNVYSAFIFIDSIGASIIDYRDSISNFEVQPFNWLSIDNQKIHIMWEDPKKLDISLNYSFEKNNMILIIRYDNIAVKYKKSNQYVPF